MNKNPWGLKMTNDGYKCFRCGRDLRKKKEIYEVHFSEELLKTAIIDPRYVCAKCKYDGCTKVVAPITNIK